MMHKLGGGGYKMGEKNQLFRKKTMERISSPEQLTDYLRVTNPGIWAVLTAVILILVGIIAWATVLPMMRVIVVQLIIKV